MPRAETSVRSGDGKPSSVDGNFQARGGPRRPPHGAGAGAKGQTRGKQWKNKGKQGKTVETVVCLRFPHLPDFFCAQKGGAFGAAPGRGQLLDSWLSLLFFKIIITVLQHSLMNTTNQQPVAGINAQSA